MMDSAPTGAVHQRGRGWVRRITEEHSLVYSVANDAPLVAACRYHF
ncbi:TPA: type II toxin-antitoxin system YoeB family toxin [Kluyvera intermedia]|nr:type II toxin-antitoxin system YoeB family toxin [Kluyvera intermedia]